MYLNTISNIKQSSLPWLTLTWDVFKLTTQLELKDMEEGLTLTWDVFKFK